AVDATPMTMFERNPMALVFSPFSPISGSCVAASSGDAGASVELVDATNTRFREAAESGIGWMEDPAKDAGLLQVVTLTELASPGSRVCTNRRSARPTPADLQIRV